MNGIIYYTKIRDEYNGKNMEHMIGEKLLEIGLEREFGRKLAFEPRSKGEHGKPFFTLLPRIHYNITHSGKYVMCLFAGEEVGIDVQIHKKVNYERLLERMVPADMIREILDADDMEKAFFAQWVLREAYIKWTGEGLSRDLRTISMDKGNDKIGAVVEVMIEGKVADENAYVGRTYGDAPKVDGYIFVNTDTELMSGDFARVHVTGALEYDLIGELEDEYTE